MVVYVLHHYFDTPDVEGNEIIGVYSRIEDAQAKMKSCEAKEPLIKSVKGRQKEQSEKIRTTAG